MARPIANYHRFYASFNKLPKHGDDEEAKAAIVSQYTNGRTTHLHEMRAQEYKECCKALENMLGYGDQRKHWRSICLHLMQELGVDTKDWNRINEFCRHPRIMGKDFALITVPELEQLSVKLRAIKRKGGLKQQEGVNTNHIKLMFIENGTGTEQTGTGAGGCKAGQLPS